MPVLCGTNLLSIWFLRHQSDVFRCYLVIFFEEGKHEETCFPKVFLCALITLICTLHEFSKAAAWYVP